MSEHDHDDDRVAAERPADGPAEGPVEADGTVPAEDDAVRRCAYCGAELPPDGGLEVALWRPVPLDLPEDDDLPVGPDRVAAVVCSQSHAARWLDGDAPPAAEQTGGRPPLEPADRLTVAAFAVALALLVGLTLIGGWTVVGWLF